MLLRVVPVLVLFLAPAALLAAAAPVTGAVPTAPAERLDSATDAGCAAPAHADVLAPDAIPLLPAEDNHLCYGKIRPGARMTAPAGCTFNWIVRDAAGTLYIGSAGHCVGVGARVSALGVGEFGTVVYNGYPRGIDWLLVRIDDAMLPRVDPTLCHWGGPASLGTATMGEQLLVHGFGSVYGTAAATRARTGVAWANSVNELHYIGTMQPGDSGAPVMTVEGEAVGIHVRSTLSIPVVNLRVDPSYKIATRLDFAMADASAQMGTTLSLVASSAPVSLAGSPQG